MSPPIETRQPPPAKADLLNRAPNEPRVGQIGDRHKVDGRAVAVDARDERRRVHVGPERRADARLQPPVGHPANCEPELTRVAPLVVRHKLGARAAAARR